MKRLVVTAVLAIGMAFPSLTLAAHPTNPSCWGSSSAAFAQSAPGALGEHAASFDEPRLGIGNVAELFTGTHQPGLLAGALGGDCD
jgi:hypothetical protein